MRVVSDTGPIIAFAKIDQLALLKDLFSDIFIPPMVAKELTAKLAYEGQRIEAALNDFVHTTTFPPLDQKTARLLADLDEGERQAIALAQHFGGETLLIIDDRQGRQVASSLAIEMTGTIGIMLFAKRRGLIASVGEPLSLMQKHGYWLSDGLIKSVKRLAGEE